MVFRYQVLYSSEKEGRGEGKKDGKERKIRTEDQQKRNVHQCTVPGIKYPDLEISECTRVYPGERSQCPRAPGAPGARPEPHQPSPDATVRCRGMYLDNSMADLSSSRSRVPTIGPGADSRLSPVDSRPRRPSGIQPDVSPANQVLRRGWCVPLCAL